MTLKPKEELELTMEESLNLPDTNLAPDGDENSNNTDINDEGTSNDNPLPNNDDSRKSNLGNSLPDELPSFLFSEEADDKKPEEGDGEQKLPKDLDSVFDDSNSLNDGENKDSNNNNEEETLPQLYFNNLVKNGIYDLPEDYEFDNTFEGLKQAQAISDKRREESIKVAIWNNMPDELKPVVEYGLSGGADIKELVLQLSETQIPNYNLESTDDQEKIIRQHYKANGIPDLVAETAINKLDEEGMLQKEASRLYASMEDKRNSLIKNKLAEAKLAKEQRINNERIYIEQAKKAIIEIEDWNNATKQNVYRTMFAEDETGTTMAERKLEIIKSNPKAYAQVVNFINHFDVTKGAFNMDKYMGIAKSAKDNMISTWERELNNSSAINAKRKSNNPVKPRKMDWSKGPFEVN